MAYQDVLKDTYFLVTMVIAVGGLEYLLFSDNQDTFATVVSTNNYLLINQTWGNICQWGKSIYTQHSACSFSPLDLEMVL